MGAVSTKMLFLLAVVMLHLVSSHIAALSWDIPPPKKHVLPAASRERRASASATSLWPPEEPGKAFRWARFCHRKAVKSRPFWCRSEWITECFEGFGLGEERKRLHHTLLGSCLVVWTNTASTYTPKTPFQSFLHKYLPTSSLLKAPLPSTSATRKILRKPRLVSSWWKLTDHVQRDSASGGFGSSCRPMVWYVSKLGTPLRPLIVKRTEDEAPLLEVPCFKRSKKSWVQE